MKQMGIGTIFVAGPSTCFGVLNEVARLGLTGATVMEVVGLREGEFEPSFVVTVVAPIAGEAYISRYPGLNGEPVVHRDEDAFEKQLRFVAEGLALIYGQQEVIYTIAPLAIYGATTRQAAYHRDTPRVDQTAWRTEEAPSILPGERHEAAAEDIGIDWRADRGAPAEHKADPVTNPDLPEPERGNFGPAVMGDAAAVRAYNQANAWPHGVASDDDGA